MAKSLRSKWKRKMKAIKRVRYGDKELKKLKEMVETKTDFLEVKKFKVSDQTKDVKKTNEVGVEKMETNKDLIRNSKTLRDQFGHYPQWMGGRQVKKLKAKLKRLKNKK